jgi:hypothetical protein
MMPSDTNEPKPRTQRDIAIHVALGLTIGLLLTVVPLSYVWYFTPGSLHAIHLLISAGVVSACGISAGLWGDRVLGVLTKLLESMPSV